MKTFSKYSYESEGLSMASHLLNGCILFIHKTYIFFCYLINDFIKGYINENYGRKKIISSSNYF